jgi:hypothetical protein
VDRALTIPAVQSLWAQSNRRAHALVIKLLDGGGSELSTSGGAVTLDLEALLDRVGQRVGVGSDVGAKLPAKDRQLVLLRSRQLQAAQDVVKGLRGLSFVLPLLVALVYVLALVSARAARREVLIEIGVGIAGAALLSLVLRRWVESYVVGDLVRDEGARPVAREVLEILTSGWRDRALWLLVTGALAIFAGWLAGPMRMAVKLRGRVAGPLERHPAWFVASIVAVVLLVALVGPARTPGQAIPLLIETALAVVGVLALRRQTIAERRPST